jgi:hypothetical protein
MIPEDDFCQPHQFTLFYIMPEDFYEISHAKSSSVGQTIPSYRKPQFLQFFELTYHFTKEWEIGGSLSSAKPSNQSLSHCKWFMHLSYH